ncbi:MAG: efflux RND transporter permease subunit [Oligoflexia bacterium]
MNSLIAYFAKKRLFGDILTIAVIVVGLASTLLVRRETFPNVNFDILVISTLFPGASPEESEKLITNPLEKDLKEVDGIKKMLSYSGENQSQITLFLDPDQTTETKAKDDVQSVIDRLTFPEDSERPKVTAINSKLTPIIEVTLSGDIPDLELRRMARDIEDELETVPGVARVAPSGLREEEIRVEADPRKLAAFRISLDEVVRALQAQNVTVPAGSIEPRTLALSESERIVRTVGDFKSPEDVGATVIRANELGQPIRVRDVATIKPTLEKPKVISRALGLPGVSLTVLKKEKADAITMVEKLKAKIESLKPRLDPRLKISYINDFSKFVKRRIGVLSGNLYLGLVLVLVLLALILEIRVALLVSLGIPFAFLGTMALFHNWGFSLNLVSLIGFIIVSGMLVDDAIVVTDNAVRLMEEGKDPETAAIEGTQQIWPAITASVLTTVLAFAPMLFMSGIFGKFIKEIPLGVILALLISLLEAFLILPGHIAAYVRVDIQNRYKKESRGLRRKLRQAAEYWDTRVTPAYKRKLAQVIQYRYRIVLGLVGIFFGSVLLAVKGMPFVLFPSDGIEQFFVRIDAPTGASLEQTEALVKPIEKLVQKLPSGELDSFLTKVGIQQQDPNDPTTRRGSEYAQIAIFLTPQSERARTVEEIIADLREQIGNPEGIKRLTFGRVNPGPPVGKAVSLSVRAKTYEQIMPAVTEIKRILAGIAGVSDINDSYVLGKKELVLRVDSPEAVAAGLSVAQIGQTVRAAFDGLVATSIKTLGDEVDIRVSLDEKSRQNAATLGQILIPNARGNLIPLSQVTRSESAQKLANYQHEAGERQIGVTADVDPKTASSIEVNGKLKSMLPEINSKFPGVSIQFGGEDEDTQESFQSLGRAFIVAFIGIFLVLVFTFGKLIQPLLVMLTIPLGIISVIWTFFLHGKPLGFFSMLGIIALAGVIVNNAIVLIDFVNQKRKEGLPRDRSIIEAAGVRFRPIFLTTATTVAGLLPTAYGIGGSDEFVKPIALALGWGLAVGSVLTAFAFPAAIAIVDDIETWLERKFTRRA